MSVFRSKLIYFFNIKTLEMETSRHFTTNRTPSLTSTFITVQTITSDRGVPREIPVSLSATGTNINYSATPINV